MANLSNINNKFLVTTGGNVGINTTSPSRKLEVNGTSTFYDNMYISSSKQLQWEGGNYWTWRVSGTQFQIYRGDTTDVPFLVDTSGRVGISTTSPGYKLDVTHVGADAINVNASNDFTGIRWTSDAHTYSWRVGGDNFFIYDVVNAAQRVTLNAAGNVGIGTTSPDTELHIAHNSDAGASGWLTIEDTDTTAGSQRPHIVFQGNGTEIGRIRVLDTTGMQFATGSSTSLAMTIDQSQRVGIGTVAPSWQLEVEDATTVRAAVTSTNNGTAGVYFRVFLDGNQVGNGTIATQNNGDMKFFNGTSSESEKMRIRASGTVGIGSAGYDTQMLTIAAGTLDGAIYATSTDANCFASFRDNSSTANIEYGAVGNDHVLRKDGAHYFIVNNVGDVYNYQSVNKANTFYGYAAGDYSAAGGSNTFMGYNCANNLSSGAGNTGIGRDVFITTLTGSNNTAVGMGALQDLTSGGNNVAVGKDAGKDLTTGAVNTLIGDSAGALLTTTSSNTAVGFTAMSASLTGATENVAVGRAAGNFLNSNGNVAVGYHALTATTVGDLNVAVGGNALKTNVNGDRAVAIGYNALQAQAPASANTDTYNVAIGLNSQFSTTTGVFNTACGGYTLANITDSSDNTAVGYAALTAQTTGDNNTAVGAYAGYLVTTGVQNTAVGRDALRNATTASYNTCVGRDSLYSATGGGNTAMGRNAGQNISTGSHNSFFGYLAGGASGGTVTGSYNTGLGHLACSMLNGSGHSNTGVGTEALRQLTTGTYNVAVGLSCTEYATTGHSNVAMGYRALRNLTTGAANIALGYQCMEDATTANGNIALGYNALGGANVTGSGYNIVIGDAAGYNITSGSNNILIGWNAGRTGSQTPQSMSALTSEDNYINIGNESHSNALVQVSWTVNSDSRDKTDIKDLDLGLDFINSLRPVTYRWDKRSKYNGQERDGTHKENKLEVGLLAQEVIEAENKANYNFENETNLHTWQSADKHKVGLQYEKLIPALINSIKELKAEIELLKSK